MDTVAAIWWNRNCDVIAFPLIIVRLHVSRNRMVVFFLSLYQTALPSLFHFSFSSHHCSDLRHFAKASRNRTNMKLRHEKCDVNRRGLQIYISSL